MQYFQDLQDPRAFAPFHMQKSRKFSSNTLLFSENFANFRKKSAKIKFGAVQRFIYLLDFEKMLKNAYLDAKIGFDTAESESFEIC